MFFIVLKWRLNYNFPQKNGKYTRLDIQTLHMYTHKILPNLWKMYMSTAFASVRQFRLFGRFHQLLGEKGSQKGYVNPDRLYNCMAQLGFSCCLLSSLFMCRYFCSLVRSWTWWSTWVPFISGYSMILWSIEVLDQIHWEVAVSGWIAVPDSGYSWVVLVPAVAVLITSWLRCFGEVPSPLGPIFSNLVPMSMFT